MKSNSTNRPQLSDAIQSKDKGNKQAGRKRVVEDDEESVEDEADGDVEDSEFGSKRVHQGKRKGGASVVSSNHLRTKNHFKPKPVNNKPSKPGKESKSPNNHPVTPSSNQFNNLLSNLPSANLLPSFGVSLDDPQSKKIPMKTKKTGKAVSSTALNQALAPQAPSLPSAPKIQQPPVQ